MGKKAPAPPAPPDPVATARAQSEFNVQAAETNARVADGRASDALSTAARAQDNLLSFVTRSRAAAPARPTAEPVAPTEAQSTPQGVTPEPVIPQAVPAAPLRVNVPSVNNLGQSVGAIINVTA